VAPQNITLGTTTALTAALAVLSAQWVSVTLACQHSLKVELPVPATPILLFSFTIQPLTNV